MPRYEQHTIQAEHNKNFLNFLTTQNMQMEYSDWYVTVAFYTALHYFEAVLSLNPADGFDHSPNHTIRNRLIKTAFKSLYQPYATLYRTSRIARYECYTHDSHNWANAKIYLEDVKRECDTLCTAPLHTVPGSLSGNR